MLNYNVLSGSDVADFDRTNFDDTYKEFPIISDKKSLLGERGSDANLAPYIHLRTDNIDSEKTNKHEEDNIVATSIWPTDIANWALFS